MRGTWLVAGCAVSLAVAQGAAARGADQPVDGAFFERFVRPLLVERCQVPFGR